MSKLFFLVHLHQIQGPCSRCSDPLHQHTCTFFSYFQRFSLESFPYFPFSHHTAFPSISTHRSYHLPITFHHTERSLTSRHVETQERTPLGCFQGSSSACLYWEFNKASCLSVLERAERCYYYFVCADYLTVI